MLTLHLIDELRHGRRSGHRPPSTGYHYPGTIRHGRKEMSSQQTTFPPASELIFFFLFLACLQSPTRPLSIFSAFSCIKKKVLVMKRLVSYLGLHIASPCGARGLWVCGRRRFVIMNSHEDLCLGPSSMTLFTTIPGFISPTVF